MNNVKFIGMDVHKKRSLLPSLKKAAGTRSEFTAPLTTILILWINFVVKCYPLQINLILSMKLVQSSFQLAN